MREILYWKELDSNLSDLASQGYYNLFRNKYYITHSSDTNVVLVNAATAGHRCIVVYIIRHSNRNLNLNSALFWSCKSSYIDVVDFLIKSGADVNYWDDACLITAYNHLWYDLIEHLLLVGANINASNNCLIYNLMLCRNRRITRLFSVYILDPTLS